MKQFVRYVLGQLTGPLLVVITSLTGIVWLTQSLRLMDLIINKGLSVGLFFYLTLLLLPSLLAVILPFALFAAVLYGYHRIAVDSELTVLRASGISNLGLATPALLLSVAVMIVSYILNLYLMPAGYRAFKDLQTQVRDSFATVMLQEGVFNTPIDGLTIYVRERARNGELHGILVHDSRDPAETATLMAETGMLVRNGEQPRFVLQNGNRQTVATDKGQLQLLYFDSYTFQFASGSPINPNRFREAKERYLHELLFPSDVQEDRHRREFLVEAHQRLIGPFTGLVLVLLALATMLSGEFNRRGHGKRLAIAVGLGVVFQMFTFGLANVIVRIPELVPSMYVSLAAVGLCALYVLVEDPFRPRSLAPTQRQQR